MIKMKIGIKTTDFNLTDKTRSYILKKINKIEKLMKNIKLPSEVRVEVGRTTKHHKKGDDVFKAEINLKLGKSLLRSTSGEWDIKVAIDEACRGIEREMKKFKDIKITNYKKGARKAKDMIRENQ
jgi:ribosomal subunit interface protein